MRNKQSSMLTTSIINYRAFPSVASDPWSQLLKLFTSRNNCIQRLTTFPSFHLVCKRGMTICSPTGKFWSLTNYLQVTMKFPAATRSASVRCCLHCFKTGVGFIRSASWWNLLSLQRSYSEKHLDAEFKQWKPKTKPRAGAPNKVGQEEGSLSCFHLLGKYYNAKCS